METIIGIDLGTTNSLCSIFQDGQPVLIPNSYGHFLTPSIVGFLPGGEVIVGAAAKELRVTQPQQTASCFKRLMGSNQSVIIGDRSFNAPELSSLILQTLKGDAEAYLNRPVDAAVITVPAYFNDHQRQSTKQSGEMAGLKVRRIINEPTAAALTYGFHDRDAEKNLLVLDLGGGTFDVTLMEIFEGTLEIIATAGESMLGGEDFTDRLVSAVLKNEGLQLETAEIKFPLRTARLRQQCESAKRQLANQDKTQIRVPNDSGNFDDGKTVSLTSETFAKIAEPLMKRIEAPIGRVLRDASCSPDAIHDIIMVGGATRMQPLHHHIAALFDRPPLSKFNPDEVVALGAAVQAALIDDDAAVDEMILTDVCPFTLGVEVVKEFGGRVIDGYYQPIIHRNTTIPVSREKQFFTVTANQVNVLLKVFQGESRKVCDNLCLGELAIKGIPPAPAGTEILVRFTYDLNGILEVDAVLPATGKKFNTVLTNHSATLSKAELRSAVEAMQELKFYPRDNLEHRRLILYSERMVGEVSPFHRQQLEESIDVFEHAMSSGDRAIFDSARLGLLMALEQMNVGYDETQGDQSDGGPT